MNKRYICTLLAVLTLAVGFAVAQGSPSQSQPDQSQQPSQTQPDQSQQMPQAGQASSSDSVRTEIQSDLQKEPGLSGVSVNVTDDKVELSGTVASQADKDKARSKAEAKAGSRKVEDNIRVSGGSESSSPR